MSEKPLDDALNDLESGLLDLGTARGALSGFLEDHLQDHCRIRTAYCILNTLERAEQRTQAAWRVLWEARPFETGKREKPPLKSVEA